MTWFFVNSINPLITFRFISEWDKIDDDNKVRFVLWTCDAYRMISQRIKYFDTTPVMIRILLMKMSPQFIFLFHANIYHLARMLLNVRQNAYFG